MRDVGPPPPHWLIERTSQDGWIYEKAIDNSRAVLEWDLRRHSVGEELRERIMRLNPGPVEIARALRGWHYKRFERAYWASVTKGEFIRKHGREAFERIPREALVKRGRRVYISARDAVVYGR